jgi:hypothetical protein
MSWQAKKSASQISLDKVDSARKKTNESSQSNISYFVFNSFAEIFKWANTM